MAMAFFENKKEFVIASYNVHKCIGVDKRFDPFRTIKVIKELKADIIALQEVDKRFGARIGLLDLQLLEEETGLHHIPIKTMSPEGFGWHGNALFSKKLPIHAIKQINLPGMEPRGALIIVLEINKMPIRIIATHLGLLTRSRAQQAETLLNLIKKEKKIIPLKNLKKIQ